MPLHINKIIIINYELQDVQGNNFKHARICVIKHMYFMKFAWSINVYKKKIFYGMNVAYVKVFCLTN